METPRLQRTESTVQQRMLEGSAAPDFAESAHEWRRLFAETWGTFLLVVVAAGADVVGAQSGGAISLGMKVVAPGMMVMAIIYFMGTVSVDFRTLALSPRQATRRLCSHGECIDQNGRHFGAEWPCSRAWQNSFAPESTA